MIEEWIQWKPIDGLAAKYDVESISDDENGLIILLYEWDRDPNKNNKVRITFSLVGTYKKTYETYRSKLVSELDQLYGTDFYGRWNFFKVNNSSYIRWLTEQSFSISDYQGPFIHFSLICVESVVDVLAAEDPQVELLHLS